MISSCICSNKAKFDLVIDYNKSVFKEYSKIYIFKCRNCGILKTVTKNSNFNPQTSQGDFYEDNLEKFKKIFHPLVKKIHKFKPFGSVLDVGCSSGILMEVFQEWNYHVSGTEPNKRAYLIARRKFGPNIKNYKSLEYFKKIKKKYDIVVYNHVLEHIHDVNVELIHATRHLKNKGLLVVSVPNVDNIVFKIRKERWESLMPREHVWHFNTRYLEKLLKENGYEIITSFFSNQSRGDYPIIKQIYFFILNLVNVLLNKGEAVTIFAYKNNSRK